MPLNYAESIRHKLRALTGKNPGHEIGMGFLSLAEDIDKFLLGTVEHGSNVAAITGELVKATGAITVTSPTAANNAIFGVLANNNEVKIKAATGKIYGDSIEGATEIKLVGYQHVTLQSDGTNWFIVNGAPEGALPQMRVVTQSGTSITASNGEIVKTSSSGATVTSPAATVNASFGIIFGNGSSNTVKAASGLLYIRSGNSSAYTKPPTGSKEVSSVFPDQLAVFVCDGTNWFSSDELILNI